MTAGASPPGASPTPPEPGQLRDTSTVTVPKRNRMKMRKSELSFSHGSASSGSSPSHFNMQANLPELVAPVSLLALLTAPQKADRGERQFVIAETKPQAAASQFRSKDEAFPTPSKLPHDKLELKWRGIEHSSGRQRKESASKFAECESGFRDGEVLVRDTPVPTHLAELDFVMFGRDHEMSCGRTIHPRRTTCWKR